MDPMTITVDFELGLHNATKDQFQEADINGCRFHSEQALWRKMIQLKISDKQMSIAMEPNVVDMLTIIPMKDVKSKWTPCVMSLTEEKIEKCNAEVISRDNIEDEKNQQRNVPKKNGKLFCACVSQSFG